MELITTAEALGAREMVWPFAVMTEPGARVWEPIWNCEAEFAVKVELPRVMTGADAGAAGAID